MPRHVLDSVEPPLDVLHRTTRALIEGASGLAALTPTTRTRRWPAFTLMFSPVFHFASRITVRCLPQVHHQLSHTRQPIFTLKTVRVRALASVTRTVAAPTSTMSSFDDSMEDFIVASDSGSDFEASPPPAKKVCGDLYDVPGNALCPSLDRP